MPGDCVASLWEIQPITRVMDGCVRLLAKSKSLHGNTNHKSQKVSKDLGLLEGLLPAVSSLDRNLNRCLKSCCSSEAREGIVQIQSEGASQLPSD